MPIMLKSVDKSVSSLAAFRAQQDAVAVRLCRRPDLLYRKQQSSPALNRKLKDWGIFALDIYGERCVVQEPPQWLRERLISGGNDYTISRKRETMEAENLLDPKPTMEFFEDPDGFRSLLIQADQKARIMFKSRLFLEGSSINRNAPLFSRRSPYYFGDVDIAVCSLPSDDTSFSFSSATVLKNELDLMQSLVLKIRGVGDSDPKVKLDIRCRAPINISIRSSLALDAPWLKAHCRSEFWGSFGVSDQGDIVSYESNFKGGPWRFAGRAGLKYYRYLSNKFGVFKE